MVISFLKKYQEEILDQKISLENQIHELEVKCLETDTFIEMLQKEIDNKFESFSPLQVYSPNKDKIVDLKFEKRLLGEDIKQLKESLAKCTTRFDEVSDVINEEERKLIKENGKNPFTKDEDCSNVFKYEIDEADLKRLEFISNLLDHDVTRAKIELKGFIKKIKPDDSSEDDNIDENVSRET
ncbi:MAG: hypothetical protein K6G40_07970 [Eubacterium sp.]|nr:hypothetical protein [Eubacterium sp.]